MKTDVMAAAMLLATAACTTSAARTPSAGSVAPATPVRGAVGDTVRVIINHVLPGERAQFERFAHEVLLPAMIQAARSDSITAKQLARARLLSPTSMDRDSTWAYVFIVDPVATSGSYSFPKLLTSVYGADRAASYMQMFRESLARPQETYLVVNTRW